MVTMRTTPLLALPLVLVAFAGCVDDDAGGTQSVPLASAVTDEVGDAYAEGQGYWTAKATSVCRVTPFVVRAECFRTLGELVSMVPRLPTELGRGLPQLDLLDVAVEESREALSFVIQVASLDEAWSSVLEEHRDQGGIGVCWVAGGDDEKGWECAYLYAYMEGETVVIENAFDKYTDACNDWWWCSWQVPYEITYGEPASIRLDVPRELVGKATGEVVTKLAAATWRGTDYEAPNEVKIAADAAETAMRTGGRVWEVIDDTVEVEYTLATAAGALKTSAMKAVDYAKEAADPNVDILGIEVIESPSGLTLQMQVEEVAEAALEHTAYVALGVPSGRVHEMGFDFKDGQVSGWAGTCEDSTCEEWVTYNASIERVVGTPGTIRFTWDWDRLDQPAAGELLNLVYGDITAWQRPADETVGPASIRTSIYEAGDWIPPVDPYRLLRP